MALSKQLRDLGFISTLLWNEKVALPKSIAVSPYFDSVKFLLTPTYTEGPSVPLVTTVNYSAIEQEFKRYDIIISDTVTWPLGFTERGIFIGQFTWQDYYINSKKSARLAESIPQEILDKTPVFAMKDFRWREMKRWKNLEEVPVIDYWNLRNSNLDRGTNVYYSRSGTKTSTKWQEDIPLEWRALRLTGMENQTSKDNWPLAVVCRPGMGIVSECISSRTPLLVTSIDDYEMGLNEEVIVSQLKIGYEFNKLKHLSSIDLTNFLRERYMESCWPDIISVRTFLLRYVIEVA
jgi:hypothetical protein